jgi:hypothetical protein
MPNWYTHTTGFNLVESRSVKDALQEFLRGSVHCTHADNLRQARVIDVQRIENEGLWSMYQTRKRLIEETFGRFTVPSLTGHVVLQPSIASAKDLSTRLNEFYL